MKRSVSEILFLGVVTLIYIFLMAPIVLIVVLSLNSGEFLLFPIDGISFRWFVALWNNDQFMTAISYSVRVAVTSVVVSGILGTLF
jgi:putative spermidine/putrescine transport system permease protein